MQMDQVVKINLGCGPDGVDGWINYDWGWLPFLGKLPIIRRILIMFGVLGRSYDRQWPKTILHDLRRGIPLSDKSVDWIYSSNFLEHLERYETEKLLGECWRVLKKNGRMRIVIPDIVKVIDKYNKSGNADVFCREFYGFDKDKTTGVGKSAIRGHQWMYDFESLSELLKRVWFSEIKKSAYRRSTMPDVEVLDLAIHEELGLYIEAVKSQ